MIGEDREWIVISWASKVVHVEQRSGALRSPLKGKQQLRVLQAYAATKIQRKKTSLRSKAPTPATTCDVSCGARVYVLLLCGGESGI